MYFDSGYVGYCKASGWVSGPWSCLPSMASSEIRSFPPGLRSWVHVDPVYSWPQSLLSSLYWRLVPIAWSLRKAFSCFQPTWVWGTMWGCLRLPWADSPPPYLLLPHHAAEGRPIKLAVSPSSTQEVRHSSSLSLEPQNFSRACPSSGHQGRGPSPENSIWVCSDSSLLWIS